MCASIYNFIKVIFYAEVIQYKSYSNVFVSLLFCKLLQLQLRENKTIKYARSILILNNAEVINSVY